MRIRQLLCFSFCGVPVYLWLVFLTGFMVNLLTLKDGHNWGDDFAQYIMYARNILDGRPLSEGILMDLDVLPPAGYSLFLVPVIFLFGIDFWFLKLPGLFFWYGALVGVYKLFASGNEFSARLTVILLSFSSIYFVYKQNILTDIPFVFFLIWTLFFWERYLRTGVRSSQFLFMIFLAGTLLVRSVGFILVPAILFYNFFFAPRKFSPILFVGTVISLLLFQVLLTGMSPGDFSSVLEQSARGELKPVWMDIVNISKAFFVHVIPDRLILTKMLYADEGVFWSVLSLVSWSAFAGFFLYRVASKTLSAAGLVFFVLVLAILCWGVLVPHPYYVFYRYCFPILPAMFFYVFSFLADLPTVWGRRLALLIFVVVSGVHLLGIVYDWSFNDDQILAADSQELFDWVRGHVSSEEAVFFYSPRALSLMTGCKTVSLKNNQSLREKIDRYNPSYLVVLGGVADDSVHGQAYFSGREVNHALYLFYRENILLRLVWKNKSFLVFAVQTDPWPLLTPSDS